MTKTCLFSPPGWGRNLRPQAVRILMAAKRPPLGVKAIHINLSSKGLSVVLEGPDEETINRACVEMQAALDREGRNDAA